MIALHEVVRHRPRRLDALEREQDRGRLGVADPDGQQPAGAGLVVERLEHDDGLVRAGVERETRDANLHHGAHLLVSRSPWVVCTLGDHHTAAQGGGR